MSLLTWTGHELVDAGIAALTVFAEKQRPEDVDEADLEAFVEKCERAYFTPAMTSYLSVLFTSNFLNPSLNEEGKRLRVREILTSYKRKPASDAPPCVYCGRPSTVVAYRDLIPMLSGRGVANFFPGGGRGLDVCGLCLLSIQALSLGAPMISGRSLVISTRNHDFLLQFTRTWMARTLERVYLSEVSGKKPELISSPRTRTVETLLNLEEERHLENITDLTVYWLSNSGQGPSLTIWHLPASAIRFVLLAQQEAYRAIWRRLVNESWEQVDKKSDENQREFRRNYLLEDLFDLPERASYFLQRYLLRRSLRRWKTGKVQGGSTWRDRGAISWPLTELFLEEVLGMKKERVQAIKELAEILADHIGTNNDRPLFNKIYMAGKFLDLRRFLIRVSLHAVKHGQEPLRLDKFLTVFEESEEVPRVDWRMARDMMLIRMIEVLHDKYKFFEQVKEEEVPELEEIEEEREEEG